MAPRSFPSPDRSDNRRVPNPPAGWSGDPHPDDSTYAGSAAEPTTLTLDQPCDLGLGPGRELADHTSTTISIRSAQDLAVLRTTPVAPIRRGHRLRKVLVVTLFWIALAGSVSIWWFNTPGGAINGPTAVFLAAGRITGLICGFLLLVEILTTARLRWIEYWFGTHELLSWHRALGATLVVLAVGHPVLLTVGYASAANQPVLEQTWSMLTTLEGLGAAAAATGILVGAGLLAGSFVRRRAPYELWRFIHLSLYAVLFLAYGHQFALGTEMLRPGFARWYWISLHILVVGCVLWGRALRPIWFNLRHEFRIVEIVDEAPGWVSIYLGGQRMDWVQAEAGQYVHCRFLASGCWWQSHPFSISAAPNGEWLRISVRATGRYTQNLHRLEVGVGVLLSEATGSLTASRRAKDQALIIAGGTGITSAVGLLAELPTGTVLLFRTPSVAGLAFGEELELLAQERDTTIYFITGSNHDHWPRRAFSPIGIRELVPDLADRDIYLCGPRWLIQQSEKAVRWLGIPHHQIHLGQSES